MTPGAFPTANGCFFRVYAPNAAAVHVVGDFGWDKSAGNQLNKVANDYWEGEIAGPKIGDKYKFLFVPSQGSDLWKIDPAARDTLHSGLGDIHNAGIVVDRNFPWVPFETPKFENLIIYELQVGSFAGMHDEFSAEANANDETAKIQHIESKLSYLREMGFNAVELMPVMEFQGNRSWGYNPSFYFAPESAYGTPSEFRHFVDVAHQHGIAVIFDVVCNHVSDDDNSLWNWAVETGHGVYLSPPENRTDWGWAPAFWKQAVKDFFLANARMYFDDFKADGLRFDATRWIERATGLGNDGWQFLQYLTWNIKAQYPDKYLTAEHLPDHDSLINGAGFHAEWFADSHHKFQRAAGGEDPIGNLKGFLGRDFGDGRRYETQWNLVKYTLGSHDDCGDDKNGETLKKAQDWERHRYLVEFYGGRDNWYARAKARVGWVLNVCAVGTPMIFMGGECHHWGYWHDYRDQYGDHRFDWSIAGDPTGIGMRRLVGAANEMRWDNPALRSATLEHTHEDFSNNVLAFKRWLPNGNNALLIIVNLGDTNFSDHSYGVRTGGQMGQWTQILCSQDASFGGWDGAGNAYHEPWTQNDGMIYVNLPKWSVVVMRLK